MLWWTEIKLLKMYLRSSDAEISNLKHQLNIEHDRLMKVISILNSVLGKTNHTIAEITEANYLLAKALEKE